MTEMCLKLVNIREQTAAANISFPFHKGVPHLSLTTCRPKHHQFSGDSSKTDRDKQINKNRVKP